MARTRVTPSRSAIALRAAVALRPDLAAALEAAGTPRGDVWRYVTGRVTPTVQVAARIHRITGGAVPAEGWAPDDDPGVPVPDHTAPGAA